jgi:type II secretory ATPase GspE/PulE/Tfp pilus assembly ATPase PilB-like protein
MSPARDSRVSSQIRPAWAEDAARLWMACEDVPSSLPADVVARVDASAAREFSVVPLRVDARGRIVLAAASAGRIVPRLHELEYALGPVSVVAGDPSLVHALLARYYAADAIPAVAERAAFSGDDVAGKGVAAYVDEVIAYAVRVGASDAHFEPSQEAFSVRLRVDGVMRSLPGLPASAGPAVVARLKVLAGLDIGLSRRAQDGRIRTRGAEAADIRVATLPTVAGECVVLRFLDSSREGRSLAELGMPQSTVEALLAVSKGHGLVLSCGPTGSGKTTTLHAALRSLDAGALKILTVEDPVEYELAGAVQVHVRQEIGLGFARVLRSFLRHDPDVILVGEIRDPETATIALRGALTGHLVFASLHCNDAAQAPLRLVELGVEPWLVGSALELAIAQRLVRRVCAACAGAGCAKCGGTGFFGRVAVFEHLRMSAALSDLLDERRVAEYVDRARESLPYTMARCGADLLARGVTTAAELAGQGIAV